MRKIISIFLLLLIVHAQVERVSVWLYWKANQTYISNFMCENRNKPEMNCKGKCFLKKKLKQVEDTQSKNQTKETHHVKSMISDHFVEAEAIKFPFKFSSETLIKQKPSNLYQIYSYLFSYTKYNPPKYA